MKTMTTAALPPAILNAEKIYRMLLLAECMLYSITLKMSWSVTAGAADARLLEHHLTALATNIDLVVEKLSVPGSEKRHALARCMEIAEVTEAPFESRTRAGMMDQIKTYHERVMALLCEAAPAQVNAHKGLRAALMSSHLGLWTAASLYIRKCCSETKKL